MKLNFSTVMSVVLFSTLTLLGQTSHLSNLSVLNQSGTGSNALTAGFTIGSGPVKQVLIRAIGPSLSTYGVNGVMADPSLTIYDSNGNAIATNDDWDSSLANTFNQVGAFPLPNGSKDAAVIVTLSQGNYTARVTGMGSSPTGNVIIELYEVTANGTQLVNLSALTQVGGTGSSTVTAGLSVAQGLGSRLLLIRAVGPTLSTYGVPNPISNPQLQLYSGSNVIAQNDDWGTPVGLFAASAANLASAFTQSGAFALPTGSQDAAILVNLPSGNYTIQVNGVNNATGTALIEAYDLTNNSQQTLAAPNSTLYYTDLRPPAGVSESTASGYATITFDSSGTAYVTLNISNLSSGESSAYLRLSGSNDYILALPLGELSQQTWKIVPVGMYSTNDIITALNNGNIYISIGTANYPTGELSGTLVSTKGSQVFTAPNPPPTLNPTILSSPSTIDASRLLTQATYGPTDASIAQVIKLGINQWIQNQITLPQTSLLSTLRYNTVTFPRPLLQPDGTPNERYSASEFQAAWLQVVNNAQDQLRHRVAFALSEIFVGSADCDQLEPYAQYYDKLATGAFGNFRDLLTTVTYSVPIGKYLTYIQNQKANPITGTSPDENYARELQQLFTVGLVQLNPDGSLILDSNGQPIPTYNNTTITETAKVLTGLSFTNISGNFFDDPQYSEPGGYNHGSIFSLSNDEFSPMKMYEAYHDETSKNIISLQQVPLAQAKPTLIPASQNGDNDIKILLDTLFNHPNTGPFICKQLIQKLVTSNPSPGYIYRVSQVFNNNGKGIRGDLAAVITTILTDYEARSQDVINNAGYGKLKEPLIRATSLYRALKTAAPNGAFMGWNYTLYNSPYYPPTTYTQSNLEQMILHSPSVFNFFSPTYSPIGAISEAGLVAPEMQITDSSSTISVPNSLTDIINLTVPQDPYTPNPSPYLVNDFSSYLPLSSNTTNLINEMNLLFCSGNMSDLTKTTIAQVINNIAIPTPITNYPNAKQNAINATYTSLIAPKVSAFDPGANFTIEAWVFPTIESPTYYSFIAGKRGDYNGSPPAVFDLIMRPNGYAQFELSSGTQSSFTAISSSNPLPIGVWTHLAITYDGNTMCLYINGVLNVHASTKSIPIAILTSPFSIGAGIKSDGTISMSNFSGLISQVSFWSTTRTQAQIQQSMTQGVPSDKNGLIADWLLDDGAGTIATDYSGNNYPMSEVNNSSINWTTITGTSLDRVINALNLTVNSPDGAFQK